jgi:hypothetical protein
MNRSCVELKGKYGVKEVLDLKVYSAEGLLLDIDTMKSYVITRDFITGENLLIVEDALVDVKVLTDIINAKYDNKHLRLKAKTKFRNLEAYDEDVSIEITVAKLSGYEFYGSCEDVGYVTLKFKMPTKDAYGFSNMIIKVL